MKRTDDWFQCSDGTWLSRTAWHPGAGGDRRPGRENAAAANVRGGVLLVHGMAEHRQRYERIGSALCERGFLVWAYDQRGHGQSAPESWMRRRIPPHDDWGRLTEDARELLAGLAQAVSPTPTASANGGAPAFDPTARGGANGGARPLFIVGHSMGSLVTRDLLTGPPVELCGAVLMGTAGDGGLKSRIGLRIAGAVSLVRSPSAPSKLLNDLTFSGYNARFTPAASEFDWLSRDPAEVETYLGDPDCGEIMSARFFRELARGIIRVSARRAFEGVDHGTKLLLLSGTEDPVGGNGAGVREVAERYRRAGVQSVELRLYEGARHELLHETNREEVVTEIAEHVDSWAVACEN